MNDFRKGLIWWRLVKKIKAQKIASPKTNPAKEEREEVKRRQIKKVTVRMKYQIADTVGFFILCGSCRSLRPPLASFPCGSCRAFPPKKTHKGSLFGSPSPPVTRSDIPMVVGINMARYDPNQFGWPIVAKTLFLTSCTQQATLKFPVNIRQEKE